MFYDNFKLLCDQRGEKPYTVVKNLGAKSTHAIEMWKKGSVPRQPMLSKIAEHFGVSIDFLLTGNEKSPGAEAPELSEVSLTIAKIVEQLPPERQQLLLVQAQALEQALSDRDALPGSQES